MSAKKQSKMLFLRGFIPIILLSVSSSLGIGYPVLSFAATTLQQEDIANALGWIKSPVNHCGGFYLEQAFLYPTPVDNPEYVEITSKTAIISQRSISTLSGHVTVNRFDQELTADKAYLYRDPVTYQLSRMDFFGDVRLREPNTLVVGTDGHYNFVTKAKSLNNVVYRTTLSGANGTQIAGADAVPLAARRQPRAITTLTAWGQASQFAQDAPRVYEMHDTSYSTCPPLNPFWHVKASHIVLNKNTGRGYATHARFYLWNWPVFYFPYLNFSIDHQRKSGFLTPSAGHSNRWGTYVFTPFYWNMAPNYDMTLTPGYLSSRGYQFNDTFRYLTPTSNGNITGSILPQDRAFRTFQKDALTNPAYTESISPNTQADLRRLEKDNTTRKDFIFRDYTRFNDNWSSRIDFNYAGDDYYLKDFGGNLNEVTQNQLLQEADLFYKSEHWNFTGTLQAYQTLNPIDQPVTQTQYRRLPQLMLNGDYPDEPYGLEYFISNEATHFDILKTPGNQVSQPQGFRFNTQPGVSLPLYWPAVFISPRAQMALTNYTLTQTGDIGADAHKNRAIPIFDIATGATFSREVSFFGRGYEQTFEPELYYDYIPYRDQSMIPVFDTTVNTLTYDQLFNYNRFTSIDRIGDANQLSTGVATRFIDNAEGYQKIRLAVGDIIYFANRRVTLCNSADGPFGCSDNPDNPSNTYRLSPISGELDYNVDPAWRFTASPIWDPISKQLDNAVLALQYHPDDRHLVNLGYNYARNGDVLSGLQITSANNNLQGGKVNNNLKLTDFSFSWPLYRDISAVGRWSQDWNLNRLQNLIYGLQYDTCCWAMRAVGAKTFTGINTAENNKLQYDTQFYFQFDLKGLANLQTSNPAGLLSNITGFDTQFGQGV